MKKAAVLLLCAAILATPSSIIMAQNVPEISEITVDTKGAGSYKLPVSNGADIYSALNSAVKAGYSEIVIPPGSYTMSSEVALTSNITINASGATITANKRTDAMLRTASTSNHTNLTIIGGTWDGNKKTSKNSAVFHFLNSQKMTIKDCTIKNSNGHGLVLSGCKNITVSNVTSTGNASAGMVCTKKSSVTLSGATITGNKAHGIQVSDKAKLIVNEENGNINISKNDWNGLSCAGDSTLEVTGGTYSDNGQKPKGSGEGQSGHGIGVFEGSNANIKNVKCLNNKVCGISPFGKGTTFTVSDSTITGNGRHGIGARENVIFTVSNCQISNNAQHGIMVNDNSKATIKNSTVSKNSKYGICVGVKSNASIKKTTVSSNKNDGIYVYESSTAKITDSSSSSNSKNGITTNGKAKLTVSGTKVEKNKIYGLNIKGGKADIQKCTIKKNKKSGIQIKKSDYKKGNKEAANVSNLSSNKISSNGQYGIYVKASTVKNMQKNKITGHKKCGIALYSKSTAKGIKKNTITDNARPVYIESGCKSNITTTNTITIDKIKKNATALSGKGPYKANITIKIGTKSYSGKANKKGNFTIKTCKLKKGMAISINAKDKGSNTYTLETVVK